MSEDQNRSKILISSKAKPLQGGSGHLQRKRAAHFHWGGKGGGGEEVRGGGGYTSIHQLPQFIPSHPIQINIK